MSIGPGQLEFELIDQDGAATTGADLRGRNVIMFFGFTNCQMVCPTALGKLSTVMQHLGPSSSQFCPVYVTVDPDRDTPTTMKQYLDRTAPGFVGLTGDPGELERLRESMNVFVRRIEDPDAPGGYRMPHTAVTYVFDKTGSYITHLGDGASVEDMTSRLQRLVK